MAGNAPHIPGCRDLSLIGERVARSLFSATSDRIGRPVTVTVFPPLSEGRTRDGFDQAAATAQRLGAHPSVLTIHEWGHAPDGRPWIVTDPQPAESVDTLLTMDGPLEVERALQVGVLLAGALETAHRAGIVHGDLQPARLVFGAHGEPLVAETGLARYAVFPGLGALNNPVRYHAPPEVLERTEIGPATDVYSLATTVYALLAGRAPQEKPAEITDSNASLLLRILQMPIPPIDRPDLPPDLLDALRAPLSPSPERRPQRAIDVAWLLQDVQRRAGLAVTEPVVLDLDDLGAGPSPARRAAPAATAAAPMAPSPTERTSSPFAPASVEPASASPILPAGAPDSWAATPAASADPWAPTSAPQADPWDSSPAAFATPASPVAPTPGTLGDDVVEDTPPPTIFPFAEGRDRRDPRPPESVTAPAEPLWPANPSDPPADALWPSAWPAVDKATDDLPAWAAPPAADLPANGSAADAAAAPGPVNDGFGPGGPGSHGGDGGSIGDLGTVRPSNGHDDAPPLGGVTDPAATDRPAELDELPAWYTDPLPNAGPNGDSGAPAAPRPPTSGTGQGPWTAPANGNGHRRDADHDAPLFDLPGPDDPPAAHDPRSGALWHQGPAPTSPPATDRSNHGPERERLPGAGDELRSLFGEIVGDEGGPDGPPGAEAADGRDHPAITPGSPDRPSDPLGPRDRPPIDLSQLDAPLGPSPYLPRGGASEADQPGTPPARLPRRHEVPSWQAPAGRNDTASAPPRLPRATDRRPGHGDAPTETAGRSSTPRGERPGPGQATTERDAPSGPSSAAMAGPPAMPVLVLIGVVAILVLGVAWLVITGDDAEAPASDRPAGDETSDSGAPTDVQAAELPEGVEVTWTGDDAASYVVTVLAPDRPPEALPAATGNSVLVPNVAGSATGPRCFRVAVADAPDAPSEAACTAGATIEAMQGA